MLSKRIIPCLDVKNGRVVKGTRFLDLKDAGCPVELAKYYNAEGADELCFLDIIASHEERKILLNIVAKVASEVFIPFTVGGGISSTGDMKEILSSGADKIAINSSAVKNPNLIKEGAEKFGSQCIVVAIDAKLYREDSGNPRVRGSVDSGPRVLGPSGPRTLGSSDPKWTVFIKGGREDTGMDVIEWVKKAVSFGAGEILLTSMDADGTKKGYDLELTKKVTEAVNVPVIASGGAGKIEDVIDVFKKTNCNAALLASILHYKETTIEDIKSDLKKSLIPVRG